MLRLLTYCLVLVLAWTATSQAARRVRNHETHDYYALHLHDEAPPEQVAMALGLSYEGPLGELPGHHTFSSHKNKRHNADALLEEARRSRQRRDVSLKRGTLGGVLWHQKQKTKPQMVKRGTLPALPPGAELERRQVEGASPIDDPTAAAQRNSVKAELKIDDPIFPDQWHLFNTVQVGHDLNVTGVWQEGITGEGATAVMVDDGIDMYSDDIKDNYFAKGSYDFNEGVEEPKPRLSDDRHGTRCAGEIAAVKNGVCGVGVAWNARIGGLRILSKVITDEDEAVAMNYAYQDNQIYSCSWGPPDDGKSMDAPGLLIRKAMVNAVQKGRQGKGNIFVFAAGNGAGAGDNCNFDGYTNSIYTITIGGIDRKGVHGYYSESCSAQLGVTYSSGSGDAIHTTDVGQDQCYSNHGGTSAAAPLAAGVFALALSARPELTWRDLQNIMVYTNVPVNTEEAGWDKAYNGRMYSHMYGYGKVDAWAVVQKAKSIDLLKPQAWYNSPWISVNHFIPQGVEGVLSEFEITQDLLKEANLERVEHVTVTMNVNHTCRGDLSVELRSPAGMTSHLSVTRRLDKEPEGYDDWTFMSVAHWGETGIGKWSIVVKDTAENEHNGTFIDWRLTLWGECINAKTQKLLPLPAEDDDDHETVSGSPTLVTIDPGHGAGPTELPAVPSDHQHRPVNAKPTAAGDADSTITPAPTSEADVIGDIGGDKGDTEDDEVSNDDDDDSDTEPKPTSKPDEHFLPHYFPTFGVSKRTQIWIYGAFAIIVLFCVGLGLFFLKQRRRRRRAEREDYEFEELLDDDEHLNGHTNGTSGKGKRRRAGELYDAFAGGSEEEDEGLLSGDESDDAVATPDTPSRSAVSAFPTKRAQGRQGRYRDNAPSPPSPRSAVSEVSKEKL